MNTLDIPALSVRCTCIHTPGNDCDPEHPPARAPSDMTPGPERGVLGLGIYNFRKYLDPGASYLPNLRVVPEVRNFDPPPKSFRTWMARPVQYYSSARIIFIHTP